MRLFKRNLPSPWRTNVFFFVSSWAIQIATFFLLLLAVIILCRDALIFRGDAPLFLR